MKELVINVVSFFSWLGIILFVMLGYGWGASTNHQISGPILGFFIGCCVSGLWFLLVSMHEKLAIIAAALTARLDVTPEPPKDDAGKKPAGWLDVISD